MMNPFGKVKQLKPLIDRREELKKEITEILSTNKHPTIKMKWDEINEIDAKLSKIMYG